MGTNVPSRASEWHKAPALCRAAGQHKPGGLCYSLPGTSRPLARFRAIEKDWKETNERHSSNFGSFNRQHNDYADGTGGAGDTSVGLLRAAVQARSLGRRVVIATKSCPIPLRSSLSHHGSNTVSEVPPDHTLFRNVKVIDVWR